ncbi:MAG TPA: hypothetical protein VF173_03965 [Thermoanaerobaculia bacterium]|nr:hypothetical protein [Thermoanaerobaculia bacterium]
MEKTGISAEYARRLYDDVLGWYHSADTKAQVVLGIDGAFVAFLASGIFAKPEDLRKIIALFSPWTWLLLCTMVVGLLASILAAIYCLWSRIYSREDLREILQQKKKAGAGRATPQVMWFFQLIAALEMETFRSALSHVSEEFELESMAWEIHVLSGNVRKKHRAANLGFLFAAVTLSLFLFAGISYVAAAR